MKQKKLMLLGGIRYLLPVIEAAHKLGHHVITCDYLPDNIAHKYSDEYHNVSIVDKDAVLKLAQELQIDGIMSFAVDPGVETAAYVAEHMGLPNVGPYESVRILQNKDLFRAFLAEHGFNVPAARSFDNMDDAIAARDWYPWPVIVKPTDSAGSKGVTRVDAWEGMETALQHAFAHSISGKIIVEEFIEKVGCTSGSDSFAVNGRLDFVSFDDQHFDEGAANPYTPSAHSWPSSMGTQHEAELTAELQRLLSLLHMGSSIYNIEARIGTNGKAYIMEVSPRGGGNRIAEVVRQATGVDIITEAVRAAMGEEPQGITQQPCQGYWAQVVIHAEQSGTLEAVCVTPEMMPHVVELDVQVKPGQPVRAFQGANDSLGTVTLRFDSRVEVMRAVKHTTEWLTIQVKP